MDVKMEMPKMGIGMEMEIGEPPTLADWMGWVAGRRWVYASFGMGWWGVGGCWRFEKWKGRELSLPAARATRAALCTAVRDMADLFVLECHHVWTAARPR